MSKEGNGGKVPPSGGQETQDGSHEGIGVVEPLISEQTFNLLNFEYNLDIQKQNIHPYSRALDITESVMRFFKYTESPYSKGLYYQIIRWVDDIFPPSSDIIYPAVFPDAVLVGFISTIKAFQIECGNRKDLLSALRESNPETLHVYFDVRLPKMTFPNHMSVIGRLRSDLVIPLYQPYLQLFVDTLTERYVPSGLEQLVEHGSAVGYGLIKNSWAELFSEKSHL